MDTVTANLVLFFFFTYYAKTKSLFAHSFPRECAENDKKKKRNGFWKGKYIYFSGRCEAFSNQKTSINLNECVVFYRIIQNKTQKEAKKDVFCFVNNTLEKFFFSFFFSEESDSKISFHFWTRFVKKVKGASDIVENVVEL